MSIKLPSQLPLLQNPASNSLLIVEESGQVQRASIASVLAASGGAVRDIRSYGASAGGAAAVNRLAIQNAINAGGVILFPGPPSSVYDIDAQLTVTQSNTRLWFPGGAKLRPTTAIPVLIAVGNIETGINLVQGNTLAANAAAGASTVTLSAGKGANITEGSWVLIRSNAVVPEHDAAVVNKVAEFVNVYDVTGDVLTLASPLRFSYLTADSAQVNVINWIEGFDVDGLSIDGNSQIDCAIGIQMSWCFQPRIANVSAVNLAQRFVRFQGCLGHYVRNVRQSNGLSTGFVGTGFSYVTGEQGLCQAGEIADVFPDRCRHGYTTGAGWTTNAAVTSGIISGIGVPLNTIVGPGVHRNSRGAGWDTHEVGMDITFRDLKTLGSTELGFQVRSVRTRLVGDCFARDCIGAALQIGSDAQDTVVRSLDWQNTNLGATSIDWTKYSPIVDNSPRAYIGEPALNELDNSNMGLWERGTSFTADGGTANRWKLTLGAGAAVTVSRQSHAAGAGGPSAGPYYLRFNRGTTGSAASTLSQYIENIKQLSGQRIAISFNAFASANDVPIDIVVRQYFGTGGSPSADVDTTPVQRLISDSFHRYTVIVDVPSVTGKTFGSDDNAALILIFSLPTSAGTVHVNFDWVKLETGRTPTTFVPTSPAEESDRCKRWYEKSYLPGVAPATATSVGAISVIAPVAASTYGRAWVPFTTLKGRVPAVSLYSTDGTIAKVRDTVGAVNIDGAVTDSAGPQLNGYYGGANGAGVDIGDVIKWQWTAAVADFE